MNKMKKWAITLAPFVFVGCAEQIEVGTKAQSGDDVLFTVENTSGGTTRTMYQDDWDAVDANNKKTPQEVYWGNYLENTPEHINIYCPNTDRGFAEYEVKPKDETSNVAATVVRVSPIGVQWGDKNIDHTFYAFYPANKAKNTLEDGNTIEATVDGDQSPQMYKYKTNIEGFEKLQNIESFEKYNENEYNDGTPDANNPKTIYGMPDMSAAVMMAKTNMEGKYGEEVPLSFKVLADVLDLTFNGPVSPNSLGGNASEGIKGETRQCIKIQTVTIDVVKPDNDNKTPTQEQIAGFPIDKTKSISGSFKLDMDSGKVTKIVDGKHTVTLYTSMDGGVPTLFVRKTIGENETPNVDDLDHLRLRAFLIPGQIATNELGKLRIHIQTDCGDFYQMLRSESTGGYINGRIYPVKLGYFKQRGQEFDLKKWIGQLDPNIYLSELSIPGAWHAADSRYQGDASKDMQAMYNAGIRAFEVHTINGTTLYTDNTFTTELTENNVSAMEFHETRLDEKTDIKFDVSGGSTSGGLGSFTGTNKTVTETRTVTYNLLPKLALRLYRTMDIANAGDNPNVSLSDALLSLADKMTSTGFMFFEFGWDNGNYDRKVTVPVKTITVTRKRTKTGVTLNGTGFRPNIKWDTSNVFTDADLWNEETETPSYTKRNLSSREAWCISINSCISRLGEKVYKDEITPNTTIRDVQGKVIFKINTNEYESDVAKGDNEGTMATGIGWEEKTPALFSRWVNGSKDKPLTVNLQWGAPVAPQDGYDKGKDPTTTLRWCFSEIDNIGNSLSIRKDAITLMNEEASKNYAGGLHRTFYESMIGGFLNGSITESNCQEVAKGLHPYVIGRLGNPTRQQVPLGLVFMNYVIPPTGEEGTYKSKELIRAIINNNQAFRLHRITDGK